MLGPSTCHVPRRPAGKSSRCIQSAAAPRHRLVVLNRKGPMHKLTPPHAERMSQLFRSTDRNTTPERESATEHGPKRRSERKRKCILTHFASASSSLSFLMLLFPGPFVWLLCVFFVRCHPPSTNHRKKRPPSLEKDNQVFFQSRSIKSAVFSCLLGATRAHSPSTQGQRLAIRARARARRAKRESCRCR